MDDVMEEVAGPEVVPAAAPEAPVAPAVPPGFKVSAPTPQVRSRWWSMLLSIRTLTSKWLWTASQACAQRGMFTGVQVMQICWLWAGIVRQQLAAA